MTPYRKPPRPADHGPGLPPDLAGPVELELAKAVEQLPGRNGLTGGSRYELKYDGYRCAVVRRSGTVRLWSRNGTDLTDKFPDVHKALDAQLERDCVLDGELLVWNGERLEASSRSSAGSRAESSG